MNTSSILALIDAEIAKLTEARALLATAGSSALKLAPLTKTAVAAKPKTKKKRVLSAEARKRIAEAQRKRWAAINSKKK